MNKVFSILFFLFCFVPELALSNESCSHITTVSSDQQKQMLSLTKQIQAYQDSNSDNYMNHLNTLSNKGVSDDIAFKVIDYANEVPIVLTLELNVSYLLGLAQNVWSICRLANLTKDDSESRASFKKLLAKQLKYLTDELDEKVGWVVTVVEFYNEEKNMRGLKIAQNTKRTFDQMKTFYSEI